MRKELTFMKNILDKRPIQNLKHIKWRKTIKGFRAKSDYQLFKEL